MISQMNQKDNWERDYVTETLVTTADSWVCGFVSPMQSRLVPSWYTLGI